MTFTKTAAVAALVAAAALGSSMTAANAHGKKHNHLFGHHHHHGLIVIGQPDYCKHWLRKYKRTGYDYFLDRYYACKYHY